MAFGVLKEREWSSPPEVSAGVSWRSVWFAEPGMNGQAVFHLQDEALTIFFLATGAALGATIAMAWLVALIRELSVVLSR